MNAPTLSTSNLVMSWGQGSGGVPTSYTVYVLQNGSALITLTPGNVTTTQYGLSINSPTTGSGANYSFYVTATNGSGTSPPSATSSLITYPAAPTGLTATTTQTGAPGTYTITYNWSGTFYPAGGIGSWNVILYSVIAGITTSVQNRNYSYGQLSDTYTNFVTGASYYCVVTGYSWNLQGGASSTFTSQQVSAYNPYGGPQGVQGYQGVQGAQGSAGPMGPQGPAGNPGLMQVNNYSVANQLVTTAADSVHVNTNPNLTFDGTTLTLTGNLTQAGGASLNSGALSGVTTLNTSGAIATSAGFTGPSINTNSGTSSRVSGVTLNNGALSGVTTLNASGAIATSAGFTGPSFSATNFVTAGGGFTGPNTSTINGININLANQNVSGVGTLSCGAITAAGTIAPSADATYTLGTSSIKFTTVYGAQFSGNAATASSVAYSGITGITSGSTFAGNAATASSVAYSGITGITSGSTFAGNAATATSATNAGGLTGTPAITVGTISCGAITSTGNLGLGSNTITSGNHIPNASGNTLGTSTSNWSNVYATTLTGLLAAGNVFSSNGVYNDEAGGYRFGTGPGYNTYYAPLATGGHYWNIGPNATSTRYASLTSTALTVTGNIVPGADKTYTLGTSGNNWSNIYSSIATISNTIFMDNTASTNGSRFVIALANQSVYFEAGLTGTSSSAANMYFTSMNAGNIWMVIDALGRVGIGCNTPTSTLVVTGTIYATSTITSNSDGRLKNVLAPISNGLAMLEPLNPVSFTMKDDTTSRVKYGFIAQEIRNTLPELVYEVPNEEKILHMTYSDLVGPLVSAVKELAARVTVLEGKLSNA